MGRSTFVVAGVRAKHEDSCMVVPYFLPVENKSGHESSIPTDDQINVCKRVQSFKGVQISRILSDKDTEIVNQEFCSTTKRHTPGNSAWTAASI